MFQEVCSQIWATLYDYPCLKSCDGIVRYVKECVRVAWGLVNQVSQSADRSVSTAICAIIADRTSRCKFEGIVVWWRSLRGGLSYV